MPETTKKSVEIDDFWAKQHKEILAHKESVLKKSGKASTVIPKKNKEANAAKKNGEPDPSKKNGGPAKSKKGKDAETQKQKNKVSSGISLLGSYFGAHNSVAIM